MSEYDISSIKKKLKKSLDKKRYKHTKGVAEAARYLAMRYGIDHEKAYTAGLLHDCAKCFSDAEKLILCDEFGIVLSKEELDNPALIHAKLGPYIAARDYGVDDAEIADAIRYHTTGKKGMNILEKIIYVADYIEPGREPLPRIDAIRRAAFTVIDKAIAMISEDSLKYLEKKGGVIDPNTKEVFEFYNKETSGNGEENGEA